MHARGGDLGQPGSWIAPLISKSRLPPVCTQVSNARGQPAPQKRRNDSDDQPCLAKFEFEFENENKLSSELKNSKKVIHSHRHIDTKTRYKVKVG